jgi:hypothetical protein
MTIDLDDILTEARQYDLVGDWCERLQQSNVFRERMTLLLSADLKLSGIAFEVGLAHNIVVIATVLSAYTFAAGTLHGRRELIKELEGLKS